MKTDNKVVIAISTFLLEYSGEVKPHLVYFNCKDKQKLFKFADTIKCHTYHTFSNFGYELSNSPLGNEYFTLADDAVYSLSHYKWLAEEEGASLVVTDAFDIRIKNGEDDLSDNKIKKEVIAKIRQQCKELGIKIVKDRINEPNTKAVIKEEPKLKEATKQPKNLATSTQPETNIKETKKRGANKIQYQIVARYMDGKEVVAYHLASIATGKEKRYTKEQALLLGAKGQITNATAIITPNGATLSGKGIKISDLPVVQEQDGKTVLMNTDAVGKVVRGTSIQDAINQYMFTYIIKDGKKKVGFTIQNAGGGEKDIPRAEAIELARQNKIGNAFINMYQGKSILRGRKGIKLDDLPVKDISESTLQHEKAKE